MISRLFRRKAEIEQGPLYNEVKSAMKGVQAYARSHGGRIELIGVTEEGDVKVRLHGTCKSCPLSTVTLKLGVERELKSAIPGIRKVIQI